MNMTLKDTNIVIVGGSSGIGLGAAQALLNEGANVTIVGRSQDRLIATQRQLNFGSKLKTFAADATQEDQVKALFNTTGQFDHLIITRGMPPLNARVTEFDLTAVRNFIDLMLVSAITLVKHGSRKISRTGSITLTSGISKDKPGESGGSVVAAVAGSMSYAVRALALELAPVRVNVVSPGWVETPMWDDIVGPAKTQMWEEMGKRLPTGRVAKPEDIAKAYVFLLESTFTTGITLDIDGGHRLI
jgi:NAD(P)-dependent dehydrogenase (short-subunit alcohol dehydrogenase family)